MHQPFATRAPMGSENSGDIDFSLHKALVNAQHFGDSFMFKFLAKALFKPQQLNVK